MSAAYAPVAVSQPMRKLLRRSWLWGPLLLAAVVGAAYLVLPATGGRISQATCDKIRVGMTQAEVEAILGGPPSSNSPYSPDVEKVDIVDGNIVPMSRGGKWSMWRDKSTNAIQVVFTADGRVETKPLFVENNPPLLDKMIRAFWRWLGL